MKKILLSLAFVSLFSSWSSVAIAQQSVEKQQEVGVTIDLNNVKDDKVMVTVNAPGITSDEIVYHIPKIVPGT